MVAYACNPSTLGGRGRRISEFEASLVYKVSSMTARAIQEKPVALAVLELTLYTRLASNSEIHLPLPPRVLGFQACDTTA